MEKSFIVSMFSSIVNLVFNISTGKSDEISHCHENQNIHVQVVGNLLAVVLHREDAVHRDSQFITALFHLR